MNSLIFSTEDARGGAAKHIYRLHSLLQSLGHTSRMVVRNKGTCDDNVVEIPVSSRRYRLSRIQRMLPWGGGRSVPMCGDFDLDVAPVLDRRAMFSFDREQVDIILLFWIAGLLSVRLIRELMDHYRCPVVWGLNDQAPLTGGCHYTHGCEGYMQQCGCCPQLGSSRECDMSRVIWSRKARWLKKSSLAFVCGTESSRRMVAASSLFADHRAFVLPWWIDETRFRPFSAGRARDLLHIPRDKKVILAGASMLDDRRKGMPHFIEALHHLRNMIADGRAIQADDICVLLVGRKAEELRAGVPFDVIMPGPLVDEITMALAYQSADVFVCPSVEDEGPMMIPEAMMCGTPVVAFKSSGYAQDLVRTVESGYLCERVDAGELAKGMLAVLSSNDSELFRERVRIRASGRHSTDVFKKNFMSMCEALTGKAPHGLVSGGTSQ